MLQIQLPLQELQNTNSSLSLLVEDTTNNSTAYTCDRYDKAVLMTLGATPNSPECKAIITTLANELYAGVGRRVQPTPKYVHAMGAAVADLLKAASYEPQRSCYRPMGVADFVNQPIGYRPFKRALGDLMTAKYVQVEPGYGDPTGRSAGKVTRIAPTPKLLAFLATSGITPANHSAHFTPPVRPASVKHPITLKTAATSDRGRRTDGRPMPFDSTGAKVSAFAQQVNEINAYLAKQVIEGGDHHGFQRQFNQGDTPGFDWNKGGRLYSIGGGYQNDPKEQRRNIIINGEPTIELDLQASHLTILHAKAGVPLPTPDPYTMPGLPRHIVKMFVTMTLGYNNFQRSWSRKAKERYAEYHTGGELQREYPIAKVRALVLDNIPLLKGWPDSPIRWGDLQFIESSAVVDATHGLCTRWGIPTLPVHDSIIVPVQYKGMAQLRLSRHFEQHAGAKPVIEEE